MEKKDAMKITIGSTWKAKITPYGPPFVPSGPNRNWLPTSANSSMAFTPSPIRLKIRPKSVFSTSTAKANCKPMPHRIRRSLISFLCVENSHATPRITARPRKPVNRPISRLLPG